jgi:hypothetical protein
MSMKNSNYTIGSRTRDLAACNAVRVEAAKYLTQVLVLYFLRGIGIMYHLGGKSVTLIPFEKLIVFLLVKKLLKFYRPHMYILVITRIHQLKVLWSRFNPINVTTCY